MNRIKMKVNVQMINSRVSDNSVAGWDSEVIHKWVDSFRVNTVNLRAALDWIDLQALSGNYHLLCYRACWASFTYQWEQDARKTVVR